MAPKRSPSRLLLVGLVAVLLAIACIVRGSLLPESDASRVHWAWGGIILGINGAGAVIAALVGRRK